ncbi:MAG: hypothetical protein WD114_03625, partial [Phycisphaerales bacterium]
MTDRPPSQTAQPPAAGQSQRPAGPANPSVNKGTDRTIARHPRRLGGDPIANAKAVVSLSGMILNNQDDALQHLASKKKPD